MMDTSKLKFVFSPKSVSNRKRTNTATSQGYLTKDLSKLCVYAHYYNNEDKPFYIGQGTINRAFDITSNNRNSGWINKVDGNVNNVTVKILHRCTSTEECLKLEAKYIAQYGKLIDNTGCLVNVDDGGEIIGRQGENNYFYNKHFYGNTNGNYGNKYSKNPLSIPVIQIDILGNVVKRWDSAKQAKELAGFHPQQIARCCLGKRNIAQGYQWIYAKDYNENKDYSFIPNSRNRKIVICYDIYGTYKKTYYCNDELVADGFAPKVVNQVYNGVKKSHKHFIFKDFFFMSKSDRENLINNGCIDLDAWAKVNQ